MLAWTVILSAVSCLLSLLTFLLVCRVIQALLDRLVEQKTGVPLTQSVKAPGNEAAAVPPKQPKELARIRFRVPGA